jgi:hypothetical protein
VAGSDLGPKPTRRSESIPVICCRNIREIRYLQPWSEKLAGQLWYNIVKAIRLRAYAETDATAWVNLLDTMHDDLLDALFTHERGGLGTCQHGNIGGVLGSPTSSFAVKYPGTYRVFKGVHEKRLESSLSHSVTRQSGRRTRFIEHKYVEQMKPELTKAYREIRSKW